MTIIGIHISLKKHEIFPPVTVLYQYITFFARIAIYITKITIEIDI